MCIMGRHPRRLKANSDPVVTVAAVVTVVVEESMLETLENLQERAGKFHYQMTSVGHVEKADTKRDNLARLWKPSVETVEQKGTMRKCV